MTAIGAALLLSAGVLAGRVGSAGGTVAGQDAEALGAGPHGGPQDTSGRGTAVSGVNPWWRPPRLTISR